MFRTKKSQSFSPSMDSCDWEMQEEGDDHFDGLPDSILLVIFNRIGDVKALGRCCVVSRRFHSLVPLADDVVVRVDCVISDDPPTTPSSSSSKPRSVFSHLARTVIGGIVRPFQALGQILVPSSSSSPLSSSTAQSPYTLSDVSHHSPAEVLKNFSEIRRLRIELTRGELGVDDGVLLKWKATFGSTLDSCVILGASSVLSAESESSSCAINSASQDFCGDDGTGGMPESFYTNGSLKLRVVWTISSLIAASARHYLLQPIIADHHETLETLDLMDADGQGVLTMNRCQLQEVQVKPVLSSGSSQRTVVPALSMRLWYAPLLELPDGVVLKGATLVAIRPSEGQSKEPVGSGGDGGWVCDAFEGPYRAAARMLLKRKSYCLEMNSF